MWESRSSLQWTRRDPAPRGYVPGSNIDDAATEEDDDMADVREGDGAPDFTLMADDGRDVTLSDLHGKTGRPLLLSQGRHAGQLRQ